jgi:hypothetical protein
MSFYCTKPSTIQPSVTLYYAGGKRWSDQEHEKVTFSSREDLDEKIANVDGKSGGFRKATVVES